MSVTNGERLVTKQDLADMYQGILPYLGGMPEVLANKFSKGDMYSTDEKMIGQWINGKPLYKKTFTGQKTVADGNVYDCTSLNIETVVKIEGMFANGWDNNTYFDDAQERYICTRYAQGYIQTKCPSAWENINIDATIYYTKTTDSAISIGDETDYSTTEKIIGTWLDGKPIYQRTYNIGTLDLGTTWASSQLDFTIDRIINAIGCGEGVEKNTSKDVGAVVFPVHGTGIYTYDLSVKASLENNKFVLYSSAGTLVQILNTYLTVQYTKTT